jgi:hypothetical protein
VAITGCVRINPVTGVAHMQKAAAEDPRRLFAFDVVKMKFRPWQAWQRPTLARLETNYHWRWEV